MKHFAVSFCNATRQARWVLFRSCATVFLTIAMLGIAASVCPTRAQGSVKTSRVYLDLIKDSGIGWNCTIVPRQEAKCTEIDVYQPSFNTYQNDDTRLLTTGSCKVASWNCTRDETRFPPQLSNAVCVSPFNPEDPTRACGPRIAGPQSPPEGRCTPFVTRVGVLRRAHCVDSAHPNVTMERWVPHIENVVTSCGCEKLSR